MRIPRRIEKWGSIININSPKSEVIYNSLLKAYKVINSPLYEKIFVSVSGGGDSDIILDICYRCDKSNKCEYVFFNTGIEYEATKRHIKYLERKYGITIRVEKPKKSIPECISKYGVPFISKDVSRKIHDLQHNNFDFEHDTFKTYPELYDIYGIKGSTKWLTNYEEPGVKPTNLFKVDRYKYLREFLHLYGNRIPNVSNKCCYYVKKTVSNSIINRENFDLNVMGIRKSEGGLRNIAYKSCYTQKEGENDTFLPIFWYKKSDKDLYEQYFHITHSDCYTVYGFKRTGCAGCPYGGRECKSELETIKKHEPKLYKAVNNIFGEAYKLMDMYNDFKDSYNG